MKTVSNLPPKGTSDWFPKEYTIRKYIFDTWREVCESFGYEEYLTPILESSEIYKAKSGEDVGGKELMTMTDRAGRELSIRPEMTPSVTRMVTRVYEGTPKPIRYFSIANFVRNQKPQRGRNREFWQLNYDLFGSDELTADIEILQIALEIMLKFNPPEGSFTLFVNNRKLIDHILVEAGITNDNRGEVVRVLDKWSKLTPEAISEKLATLGLSTADIELLTAFMNTKNSEELIKQIPSLVETEGYKQITKTVETLKELGYEKWIKFQPNIIRGFDYYDGMVFEVFDNHEDNNRSLFGGGRYDGLASIFGSKSFPAVGCAPGDETTKLFLESWGLIDQIVLQSKKEIIFVPLLDQSLISETQLLAIKLRQEDANVQLGLSPMGFGKALSYADKKGISKVAILGTQEAEKDVYKIKDMVLGTEIEYSLV